MNLSIRLVESGHHLPENRVVDVLGQNLECIGERCRSIVKNYGVCILNTTVDCIVSFESLVRQLGFKLQGTYGDLPRIAESEFVFSTTPYPKADPIFFHNEASHTAKAPAYIFFFCHTPAQSGGLTPVADCSLAFQKLSPELQSSLENKGLTYIRRFYPYLDVNFHSYFGTGSMTEIEAICNESGLQLHIISPEAFEVRYTTSAVQVHPDCGKVMFHQLALHHPSFLGEDVREYFVQSNQLLPREVTFGDGSLIPDDWAMAIHQALVESSVTFEWKKGTIAILDNRRMAHARTPYQGVRKHFVLLSQFKDRRELWKKI